MESIKIRTYVGQDGVVSLRLPITNQDIEAMVIYQPIAKRGHQASKRRFQAILESHKDNVFSDSTKLLCDDRSA